MGFKSLRVINEDKIKAGLGFGKHGHQNMEIISYVIEGELAHQDSMGNGSTILPGDVQYMSAGSGVTHSEFNHSKDQTTHLLQIWLLPHTQNTKPIYDQKNISNEAKLNQFKLLASGSGENDSVQMLNHSSLYASILTKDKTISYQPKNKACYLQLIRGSLLLNQLQMQAGDGAFIENEAELNMKGLDNESEFLFFDLC
ncbi:MAG: hypothetical protein ACD_73C00218G0003 [uncultured bacterium]|nr:MAG: hypothetical protein ACD_73C00218G0003 [uncultured bacterium]